MAWEEVAEALEAAGLGRRPSGTLLVHAARAAADDRVARRAGTASYGGAAVAETDAAEAVGSAAVVTATLGRSAPVPNAVRPRRGPAAAVAAGPG